MDPNELEWLNALQQRVAFKMIIVYGIIVKIVFLTPSFF